MPRFFAFIVSSLLLFTLLYSPVATWFDEQTNSSHLMAHQSIELITIFVFLSVVLLSFLRLDREQTHYQNKIVFGFTAVALLDYLHCISYAGMPAFMTASSTEKSIYFWLMARSAELVSLGLLCFSFRLWGSKFFWLCMSIAIAFLFSWLGMFRLDLFPSTFEEEAGVTAFKTGFEYVLASGYAVVAVLFFHLYRSDWQTPNLYFSISAFFMTLCSLSLSNYLSPSDFSLMLGHVFKLLSAFAVFCGLYLTEMARPFRRLQETQEAASQQQKQLSAVLHNLPVGVLRFDHSLKFTYLNPKMREISVTTQSDVQGATLFDSLPEELRATFMPQLSKALQGETINFTFHYIKGKKELMQEVIALPEYSEEGEQVSILCLVSDVTERHKAEIQRSKALQEVEELRRALDEHAIVAVTDSEGIITSVNEKFCQISHYTRDELIGQSHRVVNSGVHTPEFFKEMWKTIRRGNIWHGDVCNQAKDGHLYWVNTTIVPYLSADGKPTQYIAIRADITERKLAEKEAQRLALFDDLTGLPNKKYLLDKIHRLSRNDAADGQNALLILDLDNFKIVNDSLGYEIGDSLLKVIAERLRQLMGPTDLVARFGSDEFVIVMMQLPQDLAQTVVEVQDKAECFRQELSKPIQLGEHVITSTPSIGVSLFSPGDDTSDILSKADSAMFSSKQQGRNRVSFFDAGWQAEVNKRNEMLTQLLGALARHEFNAFFQPVYSARGVLVGAEVLMRWFSPVLGSVSPALFIPLAEQTNQMAQLGDWVVEQACWQLQKWSHAEHTAKLTLAVNISAIQFQQANFVQSVLEKVKRYAIDPSLLHLEVTESMLQSNMAQTVGCMRELQKAGIKFSMDDFGTGYSSLSYLTKLPIHILKIDASFTRAMLKSEQDTSVVRTILALAQGLRLEVVAEGVETKEQALFLKELGCTYLQGFYFGKPMPETEFSEHLRAPQYAD